jgi:O-antigen/teichoic acid export membrane protein
MPVGILDLSNKISSILKMLIDSIAGVTSPLTLDLLTRNTEAATKKLADLYLKMVYFILLLSLGIILFSKELILVLTTKEYHFAIYVAPIYIYYYIFGVLGMISYWNIYYHPRKTFWMIPISALAMVANTVANIILIPKYGVMGAALAAFLSMGAVQAIQFFIGMKITPVPINMLKLTMIFLALFLETGILYLLYYLGCGILLGVVIKLFLFLLFVVMGWKWKIFTPAEIKELAAVVQEKLSSWTIMPRKNRSTFQV